MFPEAKSRGTLRSSFHSISPLDPKTHFDIIMNDFKRITLILPRIVRRRCFSPESISAEDKIVCTEPQYKLFDRVV